MARQAIRAIVAAMTERPRTAGETEMQYQVKNWYYFDWLSGDQIVEQFIHNLDVVNWMMKDTHPVEAQGMGGRQVRIGKEYGEIYDHFAVEFTFPDGGKSFAYSRHIPRCRPCMDSYAHGSKGYLQATYRKGTTVSVAGKDALKIPPDKVESHQSEHDHLFAALRKGETYNEAGYGATASLTAVLGRMACYSGKVVTWDEAANSTLDLSPPSYAWDSIPRPKAGPDGLYPCALPGASKAL